MPNKSKNSGIYKITNLVNNKSYVGSAANIRKRQADHKSLLRTGKHHSIYLQNAWDKYGEESFVFEVLEKVEDKKRLVEREQHYLDSIKPEYNILKVAHSSLGYRHTEEAKQRMSEINKGKFSGKNHPMYGKNHTEESRKKIGESHRGEKNYFYGKKLSEDHKQKIRNSHKGKIITEEAKQKMRDAKLGMYDGEKHPQVILNEKQVVEIRKKYMPKIYTLKMLAKEYGVSSSCIQGIVYRRTWTHVK